MQAAAADKLPVDELPVTSSPSSTPASPASTPLAFAHRNTSSAGRLAASNASTSSLFSNPTRDRNETSTDEEYFHSPLNSHSFGSDLDTDWPSRRPSAASNLSTGTGTRRSSSSSTSQYKAPSRSRIPSSSSLSTHTAPPNSPPTTPTLKSSSRSKILASSAVVIEGVSTPTLPFEYRTRTPSRDKVRMESSDSTSRSPSRRLASPPFPDASKGSVPTSSSGGTSLAERKKRLASASGGTAYDEVEARPKGLGASSLSGSSSSLALSQSHSFQSIKVLPPAKSPLQTSSGPTPNEEKERTEGGSASKPSLRSRLFGLRKPSKEHNGGGANEEDRASLFTNSSSKVQGTDYRKETSRPSSSSSSFAASIDGKMAKALSSRSLQSGDKLPSPSSSFLFRKSSKSSKADKNEEQEELVETVRDNWTDKGLPGTRAGMSGGETSQDSWTTSLSSFSSPLMPGFSYSRLDVSSTGSQTSSKGHSPDPSKLQRTGSWPPSERRGSFVSVKGSGAGKGYRFDNAAIKEKAGSSRETGVPAFLNSDPSPNDSWSKKGSYAQSEVIRQDPVRPSNMQPSGSSSSIRSSQAGHSPRATPHARPVTSDGSRKSHRSSLSASFQAGDVLKREGSLYSGDSPSSPPIQLPLPRSSSLQGGQVLATAPGLPTTNSFEIQQGSKAEKQRSGPDSRRGSWRNSTLSAKPMSAAGVAGAGAVATIRAKFGDVDEGREQEGEREDDVGQNGDWVRELSEADIRSGQTNYSETSPQSLKTARQELSPSSLTGLYESVPDEPQPVLAVQGPPSHRPPPIPIPKGGKEEPKRPTKSPLRVVSGSSSTRDGSVPPVPPTRRNVSSPLPGEAASRDSSKGARTRQREPLLPHSPARKSIEEMAPLAAMTFSQSSDRISGGSNIVDMYASNDLRLPFSFSSPGQSPNEVTISLTSPHLQPPSTPGVRIQPVPESAKRLGALTREGAEAEYHSANASAQSLTTEEEHVGDASLQSNKSATSSKGLGKRYKSFRKVTPPVLASAFSKSSSKPTGLPDNVAEDEERGDAATSTDKTNGSTTPGTLARRRMKKWPFGKENGGEVAGSTEWERSGSSLPARGSKVGRSLRGRKEEPPAARPTIRRVFEEPRLEEAEQESEESEEDDGDSVGLTGPSTHAGVESGNSLANPSQASTLASPVLPSTPTEELQPEAKRVARRRNVIRELIETERSYASDLTVVRDIYLARARAVAGLSASTPLQTPLSNQSTPTHSPASTPAATSSSTLATMHPAPFKASPLSASHRTVQKLASDLPLPPSSPMATTQPIASPSSFASSSDPSNRSSTYTVSSQTSQTSDSSVPLHLGNPPPLPATPPNLSGLTNSSSAPGLHHASPSSSTSTSTLSMAKGGGSRPRMQINTSSFHFNPSLSSHTSSGNGGDGGLNASDVRAIFAHLETCCSFADEMASVLAASMGTIARSKRVNTVEVTAEMDKQDDGIGETFLALMPRIRVVYIDYCSRHEASMMRLQEVVAASPKAKEFLKECTEVARKQTNAWDLASLLIKPVQRVLKYPLLIQQIINSTLLSHPDYHNLTLAFDEIQAVADEINKVKRRKDLADHLITGGGREARSGLTASSTIKARKRAPGKGKEGEGASFLTAAEEPSLEKYLTITKRFNDLADHVQLFGHRCTRWSLSLREAYEHQLSLMTSMRRVYRLPVEVEGADGLVHSNSARVMGREQEVMTQYIRLLRTIVAHDWQQLDKEIRATIVPMTAQIYQMFQSPRFVMAKRDERLADYQRYRSSVGAARQVERKVLESANGFVALNAQLVEELPLFMVGVERLLDVGVQAFARLQAAHFDTVRDHILEYWSEVAKRGMDILVSSDGSGIPSMSHINPVRTFWERHSASAGLIDSFAILQRSRQGAEEQSEPESASSTPGLAEVSPFNSLQVPERKTPSGSVPNSPSPSLSSANSSSAYLNPNTNPRRPSGVAGLMRSLSGTFVKEHGNGEVPPLPFDASIKHEPASSSSSQPSGNGKSFTAPSLPSLVFRDGDGEDGFFIQAGPVPFLDTEEKRSSKEPYGLSPSITTRVLPDVPSEERIRRTSARQPSSDLLVAPSSQGHGKAGMASPTPKRHKMQILYHSTVLEDFTPSPLPHQGYVGWPFLSLIKGDSFRVLSSDDSAEAPLLFGRIDRTGDLGWVEKKLVEREGEREGNV